MKQDIRQALGKQKKDTSLEPVSGVLNMIFFTCDGLMYSVMEKLKEEGNNIIIALIDKKDIDQKEDAEQKRRRESQYDGILEKIPADTVLKKMQNIEKKNEWIVIFDFNDLSPVAEKVLAMGFTRGLFPTLEDTELEKDRHKAKEIVQKEYPDLDVAEENEYKTIDDAIQFLEETDKCWVLKGNSENAKTLVPFNDDPELCKKIIIDALESHQKDYEDGGFILEEKITGGYEITPQAVFLDGELIFTDIDIENKNIGAGNLSVQTGAMHTLVIKSKSSDKINKIAFPEWVYKQAKKHKGLFIVDAGIMVKDDKYYFLEFCFQRFGFDSFFAEQQMAGTATEFFTKVFEGKNPLKNTFGVAVRGLNMHKDDGEKERRVLEGVSMQTENKNTYIFECKMEKDKKVCTGCGWDLVVFTGASDSINEASKIAYDSAKAFAFEDLYYRPEHDLLSYSYQTSIPSRFCKLNHQFFEAKDMEDDGEYKTQQSLQEIKDRMEEMYAKEG